MRMFLLLTLLLTACGQSGDLYLPTDAPPPPGAEAAPPAASQPAPAPTEEQKKERQ